MTRIAIGRYLTGWAALATLLIVVGLVLSRLVPAFPRDTVTCLGVAVAGLADVAAYLLLARGLIVRPDRFNQLWAGALISRALIIGGAIVLVASLTTVPLIEFLVTTSVAFVVFSHHEVLLLAGLPDRAGLSLPPAGTLEGI